MSYAKPIRYYFQNGNLFVIGLDFEVIEDIENLPIQAFQIKTKRQRHYIKMRLGKEWDYQIKRFYPAE